MPAITGQELKGHLAAGKFASFYLLYGEEKLLVKRAARRLIDKAGENFPEFNRNEFSNEADMERIAGAVEALPFMAERKCVAVADYNIEEKPQAELDKLYDLLGDLPESATLVFFYPTLEIEGQKSAKWKKFRERAGKTGCIVEFSRMEPSELRKTLFRQGEKLGCPLSRGAADRLLEYLGSDLRLLLGETEKLCAYAQGMGAAEVTPAMVEELTPKSTETTVFMMVNALVAGNYEKAYRLLDALFYRGEEPIAILGAMSASYIDMYRVRAALESGLTSAAPAEYAQDYENRAFRLRNAERNSKGIPSAALKNCLDLLLEADLALKGSRLDPRLVLEGLVAKLLLSGQGGEKR